MKVTIAGRSRLCTEDAGGSRVGGSADEASKAEAGVRSPDRAIRPPSHFDGGFGLKRLEKDARIHCRTHQPAELVYRC